MVFDSELVCREICLRVEVWTNTIGLDENRINKLFDSKS